MNFDAIAIYRSAFVGAIAAMVAWLVARWTCGPYPAAELGIATAQGAIIGFALSIAFGLTSGDTLWIDRQLWMRRVGTHAVAGLVAGAIATLIGLWLFHNFGGFCLSTLTWVLLCTAIGAASGAIERSSTRAARAAFAGLIAGLIGGSSLEALFVGFESSLIQTDLARTMAGVYGFGILGCVLCVLDRIVDDVYRNAWLLIETGRNAGRSTTLDTLRKPLRIGSALDCQIRLRGDGTVAPHHAEVSRAAGNYVVQAVDGVTFVGSVGEAPAPIQRSTLTDGEEICIGTQRIKFRENKAKL